MLYSCVNHVTRAYTGLWCFKVYESLKTRYRVIFTLVVGDVGGVFCVFVVVVDADRRCQLCLSLFVYWSILRGHTD